LDKKKACLGDRLFFGDDAKKGTKNVKNG